MADTRWKNIGIRSYERNTPTAQAFVFGAYRPTCLWAWLVYFPGKDSVSGVENSFKYAKKRAETWMRGEVG